MSLPINPDSLAASFGEVIYSYTRAQAIADGVLVDVSVLARDAGFRHPVAMTAGAWADCVAWSREDSDRQVHQDPTGRLWDVLWMASCAIRSAGTGQSELGFELDRVPRDGCSRHAVRTRLKIIAGPGDGGEPVLTLLLPGED